MSISENISFMTLFLLSSYFRMRPITLGLHVLLEVLGGGYMGRPPPQIWGTVPQSPPNYPPMHYVEAEGEHFEHKF